MPSARPRAWGQSFLQLEEKKGGGPETATRLQANAAFDQFAAERGTELEYSVVPIRKLVGVQLDSAQVAIQGADIGKELEL